MSNFIINFWYGRICKEKAPEMAIQVAKDAFPAWRATPAVDRARPLFKLHTLMRDHFQDLARTVTEENGKTLKEARGEVLRTIENIEVAAGIPTLQLGDHAVDIAQGIDESSIREPLGTFLQIGPFNFPSEMFPAPSGDLYVSDGYRNSRIHRFSSDGRYITSWGAPGKGGPGEFHLPHSLLVDEEGLVYVCDRENSRIQIFTPEGEFVTMWTDLVRPNDISQSTDGHFYVAESSIEGTTPGVSVWDKEGRKLARWDSRSAHGLWVDSEDHVYLALTGAKSVDKYLSRV